MSAKHRARPYERRPSVGRCGACGKVAHSTRAEAKRAIKVAHPSNRAELHPYRCDGSDWYHVGHRVPRSVREWRAQEGAA